ncbi:MAG: metal ABC transporter substrate-binding protein [Chthoniobacteraceae bacterium]
MKRFPIFLICLVLLLCATVARAAQPPLRIVASFYPMYVITLNVVGDTPGVQVSCLTEPVTGCLHDYSLTPGNLKTLAGTDIFVANGAGMENFLAKALLQSPRLKIIEAGKDFPLIDNGNPHIWVSVTGAIAETRAVAAGLAAADPLHAVEYQANGEAYILKLEALRQKMHAALDGLNDRNIITFHEAFPYFASEFKLNIAAVIEREPGSEPSAGELADTIKTIRKHHVRALFAEPQYPAKSADVIRRETGIPVGILDPAVTGPRDPAQARDSYLKTMEANLQVLAGALKK